MIRFFYHYIMVIKGSVYFLWKKLKNNHIFYTGSFINDVTKVWPIFDTPSKTNNWIKHLFLSVFWKKKKKIPLNELMTQSYKKICVLNCSTVRFFYLLGAMRNIIFKINIVLYDFFMHWLHVFPIHFLCIKYLLRRRWKNKVQIRK